MALKIATFDLDHTLVHRKSKTVSTLKIDAINWAISSMYGMPDFNYFDHFGKELFGMTDRTILRSVLVKNGIPENIASDRLPEPFDNICKYFDEHADRRAVDDYFLLDGIEALLDRLIAEGFRLGIATGNIERFAWWKVESFGLAEKFTFGGYGEDADERADIVAAALRRGGYENGTVACHFGDSLKDMLSAKANGILAVGVTETGGGTHDREALVNAGADLVVDSWTELDKVMELLQSKN